jgi:hypothetical protein
LHFKKNRKTRVLCIWNHVGYGWCVIVLLHYVCVLSLNLSISLVLQIDPLYIWATLWQCMQQNSNSGLMHMNRVTVLNIRVKLKIIKILM